MATISLKNVVKHYENNPVINDVSLTIDDGDFVVFVGPSGCGKSTLLRMIAGLESISNGEIFIDSTCVNNIPARDRGVAMVFQSYALYPHMTVAQNMSFALKNLGIAKDEIIQKVNVAAEVLQITPLLNRKPKDMSGGQRQRVAIGRAIVREPKVFLFDEPLSNLDAALRVQMRTELARLHHQLNTTMIYVTHDQIEAMTMASKIVVLRAGIIEQVGTPLDLYHFPKNKFVASFLGSPKMNFVNGIITHIEQIMDQTALHSDSDSDSKNTNIVKLTIKTSAGFILESYSNLDLDNLDSNNELVIDQHITVGIRPEHFYCIDEQTLSMHKIIPNQIEQPLVNNVPTDSISNYIISNYIIATVDVIEQLGNTSYIYLTLPSGEQCTIENKTTKHFKFGEQIKIAVDSQKAHLFNQYDESINHFTHRIK